LAAEVGAPEVTGKEQGLDLSDSSDKKSESASEEAENNGVNCGEVGKFSPPNESSIHVTPAHQNFQSSEDLGLGKTTQPSSENNITNDDCSGNEQGSKITDGSDKISEPAFEGAKKNAESSSTNSKDSDEDVNTTNNIDETIEKKANDGPVGDDRANDRPIGDEISQVSAQGKIGMKKLAKNWVLCQLKARIGMKKLAKNRVLISAIVVTRNLSLLLKKLRIMG